MQGATLPTKSTAAAANKPKTGSSTSTGSSLLAQKMADMAKSQPVKLRPPVGIAERKAAWGKTGIIALRDLQLSTLESSWLEGEYHCAAHCQRGACTRTWMLQV